MPSQPTDQIPAAPTSAGVDADASSTRAHTGIAPEASAAAPRRAMVALSLAMLSSSLGSGTPNVALPAMAKAFGAEFQEIQWVALAYLLASTAFVVIAGKLGDIYGRRRTLLAGIVLFAAASVVCGFADDLRIVVVARSVQGIGAAAMMALALSLVGAVAPRGESGAAMGMLGTMSAVGTAMGPAVGGVLLSELGWRALFFVNLPLGALCFALAFRGLPADERDAKSGRDFDIKGAATLVLALGAYALATTGGTGCFGAHNIALLLASALGFALFVRIEARAPAPLVQVAMLQDVRLGAALAASMLVSTVMMATLVVGPFYLSHALGLDGATLGLVVAAGPVVAALTGAPAGRLADRFGARSLVLVGLAGIVAGCLALVAIPLAWGVRGYVGALCIATAGYAIFQTANNVVVVTGVDPLRRGVVAGLLALSRNLGLVTGASAMGAIFAMAGGAGDVSSLSPGAVGVAMRWTFFVGAMLATAALAVVCGPFLKRTKAPGDPKQGSVETSGAS